MPPTLDIKTKVGVGYFGLLEIMNHLDSKGRLDKRDRQLLQQGYDLFYYYYYYHRTTTTQDHHQGKIIMLNSNPFISPASRQWFRSLECNLSSSLETHKMYLKISVILLQSHRIYKVKQTTLLLRVNINNSPLYHLTQETSSAFVFHVLAPPNPTKHHQGNHHCHQTNAQSSRHHHHHPSSPH
jgi:hypothetical protein